MTKETAKNLTLSGTIYYASVHTPQKSQDEGGKDMYNLSIVLEGKDLETAKALNLPVRTKDGIPGPFISVRSEYPPEVVDAQINKIPSTVLIGNGSKGRVNGVVYTYKPRKKDQTGVGLGLRGVQITELVEFRKEPLFTPQKEGFTVQKDTGTSGITSAFTSSDKPPFEDD